MVVLIQVFLSHAELANSGLEDEASGHAYFIESWEVSRSLTSAGVSHPLQM